MPGIPFEWDPAKALVNRHKPGLGFAEAITVFGDPLSITIPDPDYGIDKDRFLIL